MSITGLFAFLVETAKTMAGESVISAIIGKLKDRGIRPKVLDALPEQLAQLGIKEEQAQYVLGELSRPEALQRISQFTTMEDFQSEIGYCLNHPDQFGASDPRHAENELVTAALYLALLKVVRPSQYAALTSEPEIRKRIMEQFPTISQAVQDTKRRREAPVQTATTDIASVLTRAGQHEAKFVTGADGKPELSGSVRFNFTVGGENGKRMQAWFEEPQSGWVILHASEGILKHTLGDADLDEMFMPGELTQMMFQRLPSKFRAKLKIVGPAKTKFLEAKLLMQPGDGSRLIIGHDRCRVELIFTTGPEGQFTTTVNLKIDGQGRLLPVADLELLETLEMLFSQGTRLKLIHYTDEQTGEKVQAGSETVLFASDFQPGDAARLHFFVRLQRLLVETAKLLAEHGFDPDELSLPKLPSDTAESSLQFLLNAYYGKGKGDKVRLQTQLYKSGYEQLKQAAPFLMRKSATLDFGSVVVVAHRQIDDTQIIDATESADTDSVSVLIEGKWGDGEVRFLTPEQYQREFGGETGAASHE